MSKTKPPAIQFYCNNCKKEAAGEIQGNWVKHPPQCPDCGGKWTLLLYNKKTGEYE